MKRISNKNIIYIEGDNDINIEISKYIIVDINKNKINFLYVVSKGIILYMWGLL